MRSRNQASLAEISILPESFNMFIELTHTDFVAAQSRIAHCGTNNNQVLNELNEKSGACHVRTGHIQFWGSLKTQNYQIAMKLSPINSYWCILFEYIDKINENCLLVRVFVVSLLSRVTVLNLPRRILRSPGEWRILPENSIQILRRISFKIKLGNMDHHRRKVGGEK
jgi:hypothetical protein